MAVPNEPVILLSYVNTGLRDKYSSLDEFCSVENVDKNMLIQKLAVINYTYNNTTNQFI